MTDKKIDFFHNRTDPWRFDDVINFIKMNFVVKSNFSFRVWKKVNKSDENQRAWLILAYSRYMNYSFNQVKALFSEHDHFAISLPETRKWRNILVINEIFIDLLKKWYNTDIKINDFPELFDIPDDILKVK